MHDYQCLKYSSSMTVILVLHSLWACSFVVIQVCSSWSAAKYLGDQYMWVYCITLMIAILTTYVTQIQKRGGKKQHNRPFYMKQPMLFCCCHTPSVLPPLLYTTGDVLQHELSNELCSVNFLLSLSSVRYAVCTANLYSTNSFLNISLESHRRCFGPVLGIVGTI